MLLTPTSVQIRSCDRLSSSQPSPLALEWSRRWFADFHGDVCVQRVPLDMNQSVGQRADAVLLHRVLCVLDFIKPAG